jgi:hypothetical protein
MSALNNELVQMSESSVKVDKCEFQSDNTRISVTQNRFSQHHNKLVMGYRSPFHLFLEGCPASNYQSISIPVSPDVVKGIFTSYPLGDATIRTIDNVMKYHIEENKRFNLQMEQDEQY